MAGGAALGEVADKVKDEHDPEVPYDPSKPREIESEVQEEKPVEQTIEKPVEQPVGKPEEKEKSGRGMFDRIASRLKRHGDEKKRTEEEKAPEKTEPEADEHDEGSAVVGVAAVTAVGAGAAAATALPEEHVSEEDRGDVQTSDLAAQPAEPEPEPRATAISDVHDESHIQPTAHDEDEEVKAEDRDAIAGVTALPGMSALDTGAEATDDTPANRDIDEEPTAQRDFAELKDDTDESVDEGPSKAAKGVAATAGIAALGGIIAAGAMGAERRRKQEEEVEDREEVSSLDSTDDDEPDRPELQTVASAEHTGAYTFAAPAPGPTSRPDLERHISTIQDSSSDEADDESSDLSESEDENVPRRQAESDRVEEAPPVIVEASEETPARDRAYIITPTPAPQGYDSDIAREEPMPTREPAPQASSSAVATTELPHDEQGNIVLVNRDAPDDAPHLVVEEEGAPAPEVKTGPSPSEKKEERTQEKEKKGLRGLFSKLKNKSKAENKLHKEPPASEKPEKAAPEVATATTAQPPSADAQEEKDDTIITPVTTTTAGHEAQGEPVQHVGTDGPIGDPKHISGIGGEPRAASPSSFRRHDNELRDLDDVSSSGADEDDYARGRGGRLAKKLGFSKGKGKKVGDDDDVDKKESLEPSTSNGDEEQFEEARDHFDESLAPPPAFAGQAKSESPNRATRFQEQL